MGFFASTDAFIQFKQIVSDEIEEIRDDLGEEIVVDTIILYEAFWSAKQTAARHKNYRSSYNKEAAHLCFWIRKLKPAHIVDKQTILSRLKSQLPTIFPDKINKEELEKIDRLEDDLKDGKNYVDIFRYPVNEKLALMVAFAIISYGDSLYAAELQEKGENDQASEIIKKGRKNEEKMLELSPVIVHSLRRDNYSAKSMAIYFEWIFSD